jgi:FAD binding domain/Berberine and berberine like
MATLQATTTTGRHIALQEAAVQELRASLRGALLRPGDEGYDASRRVFNAMIDKRPALIACCTGVADVVNAVNFARAHHLLVAVRGGGHHSAGHAVCEGGLVIDLRPMKGIRVDPIRQTVQAQGGVTWGDFDCETGAFGLATTGGMISTTGIAGLTLGGGEGWLCRKYGLSCDNLLAADVVTADGTFLTVNASEHADLFWGIRGGGGNFGIITSFEYRLHPVAQILGGWSVYPLSQAKDLLTFLRDYLPTVPENLTVLILFITAPADPLLPSDVHNTVVVVPAVCFTGPLHQGEQVLQLLRTFGSPAVDVIGPMPYTALPTMFNAWAPPGLHHYWKSVYLQDLSAGAIDMLIERAATMTSPLSHLHVMQSGGAISRVGEENSAFSHRETPYECYILSTWANPKEADRHLEWGRQTWSALQAFSAGAGYLNRNSDAEEQARLRVAYGTRKYDRLVALKNTYDPTNVFRVNHNIMPTVG